MLRLMRLLALALALCTCVPGVGGRRKIKKSQADGGPATESGAGAQPTHASERLELARSLLFSDPQKAIQLLAELEKEGQHGSGETDMAIGTCLNQLGEPAQAVEYFRRGDAMLLDSPAAKELGPSYVNKRPYGLSDLNSWGMALDELDRLDEALEIYGRALSVNPTLHELNNNVGNIYRKLKRPAEAIGYYDSAVDASPTQKLYVYNRGMCLRDLTSLRHFEALAAMEDALVLDPNFFQASHELAQLIRREVGVTEPRLQEALRYERAAVTLAPDRGDYHYALGEIHADLAGAAANKAEQDAAYRRAEDSYWSALTVDADHADAYFSLLWFVLYRANWRHLVPLVAELPRFMHAELFSSSNERRNPSIRPLQSFLLLDGHMQKETMAAFAHDVVELHGAPPAPPPFAVGLRDALNDAPGARRLRVGYVSSDFGNHPLGHDFQHFFGFHDAERFEVFAFNTRGSADTTHWRKRIQESVEHWVDLGGVTDEEAAEYIRSRQIDILFNLNGYTPGSRNRIFALRPAAVAVMWKGWAGTIGADYVPWLISDRVSTPPETVPDQYTEKVVYTPYSYFLNDYMQIHDRLIDLVDDDQLGGPYSMPAEVDEALPAEPQQVPRTKRTFLFCNFNQHYKMDPTSFKVWMGALRRTPRSKLWTLRFPTDAGATNLVAESAAVGLGPSRIVSTALLPQDTHLSGKASAHLYLDTFVYNGHTTAADALWAGVPMLTLPGAKQIGRTAAGFAVALGCNDMVAASVKEFEDEAVRIATTFRRPSKERAISNGDTVPTSRMRAENAGVNWDALRKRLVRARTTAPLFRTEDFARDFEGVVRGLLRTALEEQSGNVPPKKKKKKKTKTKNKKDNKKK